jgi:hypothetical protein
MTSVPYGSASYAEKILSADMAGGLEEKKQRNLKFTLLRQNYDRLNQGAGTFTLGTYVMNWK